MEQTLLDGTDFDLALIWPELQRMARPARERRRLDPEIFTALLAELCERAPLSVKELAALLNRSEAYVGDAIRPLVGSGTLAFLYPDQPKHPGQRYVAGTMAEAVSAAAEDGAGNEHGAVAVEHAGTEPDPAAEASDGREPDPAAETSTGTEPDLEAETSTGTEPDPAAETSTGTEPDPAAEVSARAELDPEVEESADEVQSAEVRDTDAGSEPPAAAHHRPLAARRTPPPALFEPTQSFAEEGHREGEPEDDILRSESNRSRSGTLVFGEPAAESAAATPDADDRAGTAGRLLTSRQNMVLAVLTGAVLGAAGPSFWVAWAFALALLISAAHVGLHSAQFEGFRRQHVRRGAAGGGPRWILFLILKTGVTGAEIVLVAYLTGLAQTLF